MRKVLLVDDEVHILRAAEFKLKRQGLDVVTASDGLEAWDQIQNEMPEMVVTDVQMPRFSGLELVRRIRQTPETAHLPVIMLTAKGLELPKQELIDELSIIDIIAKPFSPRELCRRVQEVLDTVSAPSAEPAVE